MKTNIVVSNHAGRGFGTGNMLNPNPESFRGWRLVFWRLAGTLPGLLLWLALPPLAALGQANYASPYTFITLAGLGGVAGSADGTNNIARFNEPAGVVVDTNGNVYVADWGNDTIRKITPVGTNWVVTTVAGLAGVAGSANGAGSAARFYGRNGMAVDSAGNLYVADNGNNTIRKMTPVGKNWVVTTVAGLAGVAGSADGTNNTARFNSPGTVTLDANGNLYVADSGNDTIRKMTPAGTNWVVTTLAGLAGHPGSADGTNQTARFNNPFGLALDSAGNLYLGDFFNDTVRKVTPVVTPTETNWVVTTLAGLAGSPGSADGTNSTARFFCVDFGAVDGAGNLYVTDNYNDTIREVSPVGTNWVVRTLAGVPGWLGSSDGTGSDAFFNSPNIVVRDGAGNLYVPDFDNHTIRKGFPATSASPATSAPPVTVYDFVSLAYTNSLGILPYRLFIPTNYNPALKYPLVLFLHGLGQCGSDNLQQLISYPYEGPLVFAQAANQSQNPSFMVAPQCPVNADWMDGALPAQVLGMMKSLMAEFPVDPDRVYITGLSLGGYGTWDYITLFPQMYAAAVPMSGGGNTSLAGQITHVPIWNFHAVNDPTVSVSLSQSMVAAVRQAGGSVIYTEYATGGHPIWTAAYNTPILMNWLYSQKRGKVATAPPLLSISNLTGQQLYSLNGTNLNLSGSATDGTNGVTGITWRNLLVGGYTGSAQGTTNWSVTNIAINPSVTNRLLLTASGSSWYSLYGGATTFDAPLSVIVPPAISVQPGSVAVNADAAAAFSVLVAPYVYQPSYQWFYQGQALAGATGALLLLTNVGLADAGGYSVSVSNVFGCVTSSNALLTLLPPSLVQNGGFELGTFADWTTNGNFENCNVTSSAPYVNSGVYGAEFGPVGTFGYLSQTLPTAAGGCYLLSFWLDSPDGLTPNEGLVSWNGNTLFDQANLPAFGWTNLQFVVTATGTSTVLQFGFRDDAGELALDDVSVLAAQPSLLSLNFSGTNLVVNGNNGLSGRTYMVLTSTNLTLPLSQWTPVATNMLNAYGNFALTATNAVDPNTLQRFYQVVLLP